MRLLGSGRLLSHLLVLDRVVFLVEAAECFEGLVQSGTEVHVAVRSCAYGSTVMMEGWATGVLRTVLCVVLVQLGEHIRPRHAQNGEHFGVAVLLPCGFCDYVMREIAIGKNRRHGQG